MVLPRLFIDTKKIHHNVEVITTLLKSNGVESIFPVVKVFAGNRKLAQLMTTFGFDYLADSRIENLKAFQSLPAKKVCLRISSKSEIQALVRYADVSLQSEVATIALIQKEALRQGKVHSIILMFDLGDLREGIFYEADYLPIVASVLQLSHVKLLGIGTNLTCYGGVVPSLANMNQLLHIKASIEAAFGISIPLVSGGNSSIFPLLQSGNLPRGINQVRVGEAFFFGRETAYGEQMANTYADTCFLEAEIIECYEKPTYPIGEMTMDSFGNPPHIQDIGPVMRAILNIGKQDVWLENLFPVDPKVKILGGSSDHLIVHLKESHYQLGDKVLFYLNYPGLLQANTSKYVKKVFF